MTHFMITLKNLPRILSGILLCLHFAPAPSGSLLGQDVPLAGKVGGGTSEATRSNEAEEIEPLAQRIDSAIQSYHIGPEFPLATDAEFLRRIYLDIIGRGPTAEEHAAFLARVELAPNTNQLIRIEVIDDLLNRDEFFRYYAKVLEVMFTERRELIGTLETRAFIRKWLEDRKPLNELCMEILGSDGSENDFRAAAAFFLNRQAEPQLMTRDIGRIFFGRDVQCAQCHDHPLVADYEQSEYYGILTFVNRSYLFLDGKRNNAPSLGEKAEGNLEYTSVFRPGDRKTMAEPTLPSELAMDIEPEFADTLDAYIVAPEKEKRGVPRYSRRQQLAVLATHPENQSFNRNLANRLWANMFGKGVVHPLDMHHSDNPPISAALLRLLADALVDCNYDLREILRQIARSKAYQRSVLMPDLQNWDGPSGGFDFLDSERKRYDQQLLQIELQIQRLNEEQTQARDQLSKAKLDVSKLQVQIEDAKKQSKQVADQQDQENAKLEEMRVKQAKQQETIAVLQKAVDETAKVVQLQPEDKEIVASQMLLQMRLAAATEQKAILDDAIEEQQETVEKGTLRIDGQRNRILALTNRRLALAEFVIEARGVQRRLQQQLQAATDSQTDAEVQKVRIDNVKGWLKLRSEVKQAQMAGNFEAATDWAKKFELQQADLIEQWRRDYALRSVRALNPEQMTGATYTALEMDRAVRAKANSDWDTKHQNEPAIRDDAAKRQAFINSAVAENMWDTVEDHVVTRFSAPAGNPQDVFFATVDQALMIQNDPSYQAWLKANDGNLISRMHAISDAKILAEQLYLSILCRKPEKEEIEKVLQLLNDNAANRLSVIQDLVWGLLASSEFRFSM